MKIAVNALFIFLAVFANAQNGPMIIEDQLIVDLSHTPIYELLVYVQNEDTVYKERFELLNDIEIHNITYMSDGLKIKGHYLKPKTEGSYPCLILNRGGNCEYCERLNAHYLTTISYALR